jgi:predicted NAD/FAD-dependent oxidoreductase
MGIEVLVVEKDGGTGARLAKDRQLHSVFPVVLCKTGAVHLELVSFGASCKS